MTPEYLLALGSLIVSVANAFAVIWGAVKINKQGVDIRKIEIATNSMKDALVTSTAKASLAEGHAAGRLEAEAEAEERRRR